MRRSSMKDQKSSWPKVVATKWLNINNGSNDNHSHNLTRGCLKEIAEELSPLGTTDQPAVTNHVLNLKMLVGTWNVNGKSPHGKLDLGDWLGTHPPADVYVLGFQEIVPLNAGNVLGTKDNNNGPAAMWVSLIDQVLNRKHDEQDTIPPSFSEDNDKLQMIEEFERSHSSNSSERRHEYCLAASKQMVGIFLCVWIRSDLNSHVNSWKVSCAGTGIMGYLGNKGSVCISMTLHGESFCFVCTHLASGDKEGDEVRRNSDVAEILRKTKFTHSRGVPGLPLPPQNILNHDKIIWLGDLNYRLITSDHGASELLKKSDWQAALEKDQLMAEQRAGRVFKGWEEGRIEFAPTYKYRINSDEYAFNTSNSNAKGKGRVPAWCDRILWKGEGLKQTAYNRSENKFSDHRPVYAHFSMQLDSSKTCNAGRSFPKAKPSSRNAVIQKNKVQAEELLAFIETELCCSTETIPSHGPIWVQS